MSDHDDRRAGLFRETGQLGRAFPDLRHGTRRGCQGIGIQGLDGIDDRHIGFAFGERAEDFLKLDFGLELQVRRDQSQPSGTQRHLCAGFLAADVEDVFFIGQIDQRLQQQGRFADTRVAADQDDTARHQPAAQHPVEFTDA